MTNYDVIDSRFHMVLSSNTTDRRSGYQALTPNRWEFGSFVTYLKTPLKTDPVVRYLVSLRDISVDFAVQNVSVRDNISYIDPELKFWNAFTMRKSGHFSTIRAILEEIAYSMPENLADYLGFRINDLTNRVEITCKDTECHLSENLAKMLGFNVDNICKDSVNEAIRPADPFILYHYVHLLSPSLCEMCYVSGQSLPLLRSLSIPSYDLSQSTRVILNFSSKHYVPLQQISNLSSVQFCFVRADDSSLPVQFLPDCQSCTVSLDFKRDYLQFP